MGSLVANARQLDLLRLVRAEAPVTRGDLSRRTGLSASQVSRIVSELIGAGLVEVDDRAHPATGRPSDLLRLAGDGRWVVGLEIGGGMMGAVVTNLRGEVRARLLEPLPPVADREEAVACFADLAQRALARSAARSEEVLGLGAGLYAVVDPVQGTVLDWSEHPGWDGWWRGFGLRDALRDRLGWEHVTIDDAVRMRAVAEARRPAPGVPADFVYVLADSGIGAALVIDGRAYFGPNRLAGEIGHVAPEASDEPCACGRRGCLEAVASSSALEREARRTWPDPLPDAREVLAMADGGDDRATAMVERAGDRLAAVLASAVSLVCPSLVVVGGALARSSRYLAAVDRGLAARIHPRATAGLRVERSGLGPEAGVIGAATAALDELFVASP